MKVIYSITVYNFDESLFSKEGNWTLKSHKRDRRWGHFFDKEKCLKYVKNNVTDLYEHFYYNYVCITEENEGICPHNKEWWYKVVYKEGENNYLEFDKVEFIGNSIFSDDFQPQIQTDPLT